MYIARVPSPAMASCRFFNNSLWCSLSSLLHLYPVLVSKSPEHLCEDSTSAGPALDMLHIARHLLVLYRKHCSTHTKHQPNICQYHSYSRYTEILETIIRAGAYLFSTFAFIEIIFLYTVWGLGQSSSCRDKYHTLWIAQAREWHGGSCFRSFSTSPFSMVNTESIDDDGWHHRHTMMDCSVVWSKG